MTTPPPPYYGPPGGDPAAQPQGQQNTFGLVGMIVGIISIPLACCAWIGMIVGIVGGVFSYLGLQKANQGLASNRSQAKAGLICSIVGVVLGLAVLILSIWANTFDWQTWIDQNSTN
ncbi:hypothetical protein Aab01nite_75770 [Paractinoplanes abujensis]|uniref:Putative membrane protein n=1 Tax=Paractinoplanes abujensis TaxID=882441 RepID=A0A7W7CV47_9ACTN|nr:DUF4190 domain-containing protein [Actinoplanes abujensis]MBB4695250.1 putative membrane protein [Actinoplanes abujensis]GID23987.1 hypothetical protein Aab01nite_75770 [Actinoplanes abujensis]